MKQMLVALFGMAILFASCQMEERREERREERKHEEAPTGREAPTGAAKEAAPVKTNGATNGAPKAK